MVPKTKEQQKFFMHAEMFQSNTGLLQKFLGAIQKISRINPVLR